MPELERRSNLKEAVLKVEDGLTNFNATETQKHRRSVSCSVSPPAAALVDCNFDADQLSRPLVGHTEGNPPSTCH